MKRALLAVVLVSCGTSTPPPAPPMPPMPPPSTTPSRICRSGAAWSPGQAAFVERTDAWGLSALNIRTFSVADVDGDGWADITAIIPASTRGVGRVYLNRAGPNGGRAFVNDWNDTHLFDTRDGDPNGRLLTLMTFGDVDNDGTPDAFMDDMDYPASGLAPPIDGPDVALNKGKGSYVLAPSVSIVGPSQPMTTGAFFLDYNLDGLLDVAIGYWWEQPAFTKPFGQQPQLFQGDGTGMFSDVTKTAGLQLLFTNDSVAAGTNARPLFGITPCDVNGDGRLDIVGSAYGRYFNELFVANGDNTFTEDARARGVAADDRLDYHDDQSFRCYCSHHVGDAYCAGAQAPWSPGICTAFGGQDLRGWQPGVSDQPYSLGGNTFTYVCEDFDNDGDDDLYETNIKHPDVGTASDPSELLVNDGTGHFARPGREMMGLTPPIDLTRIDEGGQQGAALDFDNDGRLDVMLMGSPYPKNRGWVFHQKREGSLQFEYIGHDAGYDHACPSGIAIADFDHDGDEDFVTGTYGCNDQSNTPDYTPADLQPTRFYENVSNDGNWVSVKLVGQGGAGHANASALGARVRVTAGGVTQQRTIHGSWGQGAMSREQVAFFGLGSSCDIEKIEVRWPNGALTTQTFTGVLANYRVELHEGDDAPHYLP
jgi:hypothetical protein